MKKISVQSISMKKIFLSVFFLFFSIPTVFGDSFYKNGTFFISPAGGVFSTGVDIEIQANNPDDKIFWTLHPNRALEAGNVSTGATQNISLRRSADLGIFTFGKNGESSMEIFRYIIESPRENEYFRFSELDPNPEDNFLPTFVLENASQYSMSMEGWKIIMEEEIFELPDEEIESGEFRRFIFPLTKGSGTVFLVSPKGIKKDFGAYKNLQEHEYLKRKISSGKRETRPAWEILKR